MEQSSNSSTLRTRPGIGISGEKMSPSPGRNCCIHAYAARDHCDVSAKAKRRISLSGLVGPQVDGSEIQKAHLDHLASGFNNSDDDHRANTPHSKDLRVRAGA